MKTALMAGALAVSLWGGAAFAHEEETVKGGAGEAGQSQAFVVEPAPTEEVKTSKEKKPQQGVQAFIGGGIEGYTGGLAPLVNPGAAYGVTLGFRPIPRVGLELGYDGAVNGVDTSFRQTNQWIVKNGGNAMATIGFTSTRVQPYVAGGFGLDRYNVKGNAGPIFHNDTVGFIPVGLGLRTQMGAFTADARASADALVSQDFAPEAGPTTIGEIGVRTPTGRYNGMIRVGATF